MNNKAQRQSVKFPALLNLANDRPHIDTTLQNFEELNGPYLNGMISPLYLKDNGSEGVYDLYGRKHTVDENGNWCIDGAIVKSGYNHTFERTELDTNYKTIIGTAYRNNKLELATVEDNIIYVDNIQVDTINVGHLIDSRLVYLDNKFILVVITASAGTRYIKSYIIDGDTVTNPINEELKFYRQTLGSNSTDLCSVKTVDPIIQICSFDSGKIGLSIMNKYGEAINTRYNGFMTYVIDGDTTYKTGDNLAFQTGTITHTADYHYKDTLDISYENYSNGIYAGKGTLCILLDPETATNVLGWTPGTTKIMRYDNNAYTDTWAGNYVWLYITNTGTSISNSLLSASKGDAYIVDDYWYVVPAYRNGNYHMQWSPSGSQTYMDWMPNNFVSSDSSVEFTVDMGMSGTEGTKTLTNILAARDYKYAGWKITASFRQGAAANNSSDFYYDGNSKKLLKLTFNTTGSNSYLTTSPSGTRIVNQLSSSANKSISMYFGQGTSGNYKQDWNITLTYYVSYWADTTMPSTPSLSDALLSLDDGTNGTQTFSPESDSWNIPFDYSLIGVTNTYTILNAPNVFLDNGNVYSVTGFTQSSTNNNSLSANTVIYLSGENPTISSGVLTSTPMEIVPIGISDWVPRSNSIVYNQNMFGQTYKLSNNAITPASLTAGDAENTSAKFMEFYNSNSMDLKYMPGTSRYTLFNYYSDYIIPGSTDGNAEDRLVYCTIGSRVPVYNGCKFKILYNTTTDNSCYIQGISYSLDDEYIGTLLTPWQSIAEDFYIAATTDKICYKDKMGKFIEIERKVGNSTITPILDGRYLVMNTDRYWNLFDSKDKKFYHYASDWNFRCLAGSTDPLTMTAYKNSIYTYNFRYIAASQNQVIARLSSRTNYSNPNVYPVASWQIPVYAKARIDIESGIDLYGASEPTGGEQLGVDVYYTNVANSNSGGIGDAYYQFTYKNGTRSYSSLLANTTYVITTVTSSFVNPSLFAKYLDGAGNNDLVFDIDEGYTLNYYNNEITFIYPISSEVNNVDAFFVIQGQFYAVINEKICAITYSEGAVATKDPIVDIKGLLFLGNNPMIAFFFDPVRKVLKSFTGDASLEDIYDASKLTINEDIEYRWYDETTQTIYVATSAGLLCLGIKSTWLLPNFTNTTLMQFDNSNITHIQDDGKDYGMVYYKQNGYEPLSLDLETSFYGLGNTENGSIDRWNVTLYDINDEKPTGDLIVGVRSITDITVKSEEKKVHVTPDMWDKWSNSILITYNPKLIKGQGIRLYLKSPFAVQNITAHVMGNGTGTMSNQRGMV